MIFDTLKNAETYPLGDAWSKAIQFIMSLTNLIDEGEYPIQCDDIFAMVSGYQTKGEDQVLPESHRAYVDIQSVLLGREAMLWHPVSRLTAGGDYDAVKDIRFYRRPQLETARMVVSPGIFTVFFPEDGHMPGLIAEEQSERVKKVVVKVRTQLLTGKIKFPF